MILNRLSLTLFVIGVFSVTPGCGKSHRVQSDGSISIAAPPRESEANRLWEASSDVLRRHGYRLDRADRRAGVMTTWPEESQHFFEFWRHDVDTFKDRLEATVNPLRRWVEVQFKSAVDESPGTFQVVVHKERLSSPARQFKSSGAAYQFFGETLPSTTGAIQVTSEDDRWLDLGRDSAMEVRITSMIQTAVAGSDGGR